MAPTTMAFGRALGIVRVVPEGVCDMPGLPAPEPWPHAFSGKGHEGSGDRLSRGRSDRSGPPGTNQLPWGPSASGRLTLQFAAQPSTPVAEWDAPTGLLSGEPR